MTQTDVHSKDGPDVMLCTEQRLYLYLGIRYFLENLSENNLFVSLIIFIQFFIIVYCYSDKTNRNIFQNVKKIETNTVLRVDVEEEIDEAVLKESDENRPNNFNEIIKLNNTKQTLYFSTRCLTYLVRKITF